MFGLRYIGFISIIKGYVDAKWVSNSMDLNPTLAKFSNLEDKLSSAKSL